MRRSSIGAMLGAALLCLSAATGLAQKAPDPMLGTWRITGQSVVECMLDTPAGTMEVLRPLGDGSYAVRLSTTWRHEALPNCPPPDPETGGVHAEGTLRRSGRRVTLEIVRPDGESGGPWAYELEPGDQAMRFLCPECIKTTFRWQQGR